MEEDFRNNNNNHFNGLLDFSQERKNLFKNISNLEEKIHPNIDKNRYLFRNYHMKKVIQNNISNTNPMLNKPKNNFNINAQFHKRFATLGRNIVEGNNNKFLYRNKSQIFFEKKRNKKSH